MTQATGDGVSVENVCICVTRGSCPGDIEESDGSLDTRINFVTERTTRARMRISFTPRIVPVTSGKSPVLRNQTTCDVGLSRCCTKAGFSCGVRYPPVANAPKVNETGFSAYGAYPWDAAILSNLNAYIGSGALINNRHVVTVAHKVYKSDDIKCRFGEWNINSNFENFPAIDVDVDEIILHPDFKSLRTLKNNIAILVLETPGVEFGVYPTITSICLPSNLISDRRCWVSGWGKTNFTHGSYQTVMKEVNLPLVDPITCENQLKRTRLGSGFNLDTNSFVCAGGELNKDACTGDGGAALACEIDGRFYLHGLVAWGIGCGDLDVPGVYVNVFNFIPWIQLVVRQTPDIFSGDFTTQTIRNSTTPTTARTTVATFTTPRAASGVNTTVATTRPTSTSTRTAGPSTSRAAGATTTISGATTTISGAETTEDSDDENNSTTDENETSEGASLSSTSSGASVASTTSVRVTNATTARPANTTVTTRPPTTTVRSNATTTTKRAGNATTGTTKPSGTTVRRASTTTVRSTVKSGNKTTARTTLRSNATSTVRSGNATTRTTPRVTTKKP